MKLVNSEEMRHITHFINISSDVINKVGVRNLATDIENIKITYNK